MAASAEGCADTARIQTGHSPNGDLAATFNFPQCCRNPDTLDGAEKTGNALQIFLGYIGLHRSGDAADGSFAAAKEIARADEYDYIVINDVLEDAVADVNAIIRSDRAREERNEGIAQRVLNS